MCTIRSKVGRVTCSQILKYSALITCCCVLSGTLKAQPADPIPPPTTPNTEITNLNSAVGYVRAKATPDECWTGLGENTRWDFINQQTLWMPCGAGQIPKVDQGYIWGQVRVGNQIFFGTFANPQCLGPLVNTTPQPVVLDNAWACEYQDGAYANVNGGPLPPALADYRPPRMYIYDIPSKTIRDITPKLGGSPPSSVCGPTGTDPLCTDLLWNTTIGIHSATSYVEPTTNNTYVIVSGQALAQGGQNSINFFVWGITENRWVGKFQLPGYADMRHWLNYERVLYGAVFKPTPTGGALLRYTGNFTVIPPSTPSADNGYNAIPACGTTSTAIPPVGTSFCIAFQDVGDFDSPASEVVVAPAGSLDVGRIFVGTWPPSGPNPGNVVGGIFMGPVVPAGGLTSENAAQWTKVWNAGNYEPDPLIKLTYGTGAMSFFNGYLYWGTLNPPLASINKFFQTYGQPADQQTVATDAVQANRTAVLFRAVGFSTGSPTINLLYGEAMLPVYTPPVELSPGGWALAPNNVPTATCATACGVRALYGQSGFGNVWTNYMWSMALINSRLYVGTMNWEFVAYAYAIKDNLTLPPNLPVSPADFGAGLFYFADADHAAIPVSTNGVGNFLNYGVRNIIPYNSTTFFLGMANPMNLATSGDTNVPGAACSVAVCRGGWELIEIGP